MAENNRRFWVLFIKNRIAMFSFFVIVSLFVLSLFSYVLIPDSSPHANQQFPTISLQKPGFTTQILRVPGKKINNTIWQILLNGRRTNDQFVAFKDIEFLDDILILQNHFTRKTPIEYSQFVLGPDPIHPNTIQRDFIFKKTFYLGTDKFGRDILSRIILGIRISIFVGFVAVLISLIVGILLGAIAGYYGGFIDDIIMFIINVNWSIPTLLMVFAIVLAFDRGVSVIFIAVGLTMWVEVARIVRGQVMALRKEPYVMAAYNMGVRTTSILFKHILPNILGPILVIAAANFSTAVLVEAGLSYLGFGVEPPMPSIGNMLNEHYGYAITGKVFLAIVPAITLMVLVLSFNLVGAGLRDAFDVKRQDI